MGHAKDYFGKEEACEGAGYLILINIVFLIHIKKDVYGISHKLIRLEWSRRELH